MKIEGAVTAMITEYPFKTIICSSVKMNKSYNIPLIGSTYRYTMAILPITDQPQITTD